MRIGIARIKDNIHVIKDYTDITDKGEVAQMIVELKIIITELLELWQELSENEAKS